MSPVLVRDALPRDLRAIMDLHNALIPTTTITWTEELETYAHRAAWFDRQLHDGNPVLVAEDAGEIVGFATYESFRGDGKWPGYRDTAELSVHVRESHWGRGIGRARACRRADRASTNSRHPGPGGRHRWRELASERRPAIAFSC